MFRTAHTDTTTAPVHAVWTALRALHSGEVQVPGGDVFVLHGPYAIGTELSVTPAGQDTFRSTIIELDEDVVYADATSFGPMTLTFRHRFEPTDADGARVTHELVIEGGDEDETNALGAQIAEDFPASMRELFDLASRS